MTFASGATIEKVRRKNSETIELLVLERHFGCAIIMQMTPFPIITSEDALVASDWYEENGLLRMAQELRQYKQPARVRYDNRTQRTFSGARSAPDIRLSLSETRDHFRNCSDSLGRIDNARPPDDPALMTPWFEALFPLLHETREPY
jgi:hypothetical protein